MKIKFIYIIIAISFFSCQNENRVQSSELILKDSFFYKGASLYTGWATEYFSNGNLKSEKYYSKGMQNGISREYYETGQLMQEIKPMGYEGKALILSYHENGQMSMRILLRSNKVDENEFKLWDENGNEVESSFQEWFLFLQSQGHNVGYIPSEKELEKIRPEIRDSLLNKE